MLPNQIICLPRVPGAHSTLKVFGVLWMVYSPMTDEAAERPARGRTHSGGTASKCEQFIGRDIVSRLQDFAAYRQSQCPSHCIPTTLGECQQGIDIIPSEARNRPFEFLPLGIWVLAMP